MDYPYATVEYYEKLIEEGHDRETYQKCIDDLPKLSMANTLSVRVYNLMHTVEGVGFWDVLGVLGLDLTRSEIYVLFLKMMRIKEIIAEHERIDRKPEIEGL
jgi:hypothetical protein